MSEIIEKNIKINNLHGVYFLTLKSKISNSNDEFGIKNIKINTNKFMILNEGTFYKPTGLSFDIIENKKIHFYFRTATPLSIITTYSGEATDVVFENKKNNLIFIPKLRHHIKTNKDQLRIIGNNFSFLKYSFFNYSRYEQGDNYIVTDNLGNFNFSLYKLVSNY